MPQRALSDVKPEAPWGWGESEPGPRPRQLSAATSASSPVSLTPAHISLHLLQCASASLHPSASSRGSLHIRGVRQHELCLPPRSPVGIHQAVNVLEPMTVKAACLPERSCGARKVWKRELAFGHTVAQLLFYTQSGAAACNILQIQTCTGQGSKCLCFFAVELYADKGLINASYSVGDGSRLAELTCDDSPITSATNEIVFCTTTQTNYWCTCLSFNPPWRGRGVFWSLQ